MSQTVDTYITKLVLDDGQYKAKAREAKAEATGLSSALSGVGAAAGSAATIIGSALVVALTAGAAGMLAVAKQAIQANATMDSLMRGLTAVAGSSQEAEAQFKRLKEVAKLPGLGLAEAIQGSTNLQAAGLSAQLAESALMGFGNALATVGKGREDLQGVIMALSQIMSKGKVSAEEINQIAERVPQIRTAMQTAFGTANTEQLQKMGLDSQAFIVGITRGLNKLPKAAGGIANAFENIKDAMFQAFSAIGKPINAVLGPIIERVSGFFEFLANSGAAERVGKAFAGVFGLAGQGDGLIRFLSYVVAALESLPQIIESVAKGVSTGLQVILTKTVDVLNFMVRTINKVSFGRAGLKEFNKDDLISGALGFGGISGILAAKIKPRADELFSQFASQEGNGSVAPGSLELGGGLVKAIAESTRKTAENTEKIADFQRNIIGGNDLGRAGIAPVELGRMRGSNRRVDVNFRGAANQLESAVQKLVMDALNQYERARAQRA